MGLLQSIDATQRKTLSALAFLTFVAVSKTLLTKLVFTHVHTPWPSLFCRGVATNVCMSPIFFFKRDLWARPSRASLKGFALVCLAIAVDLGFTNVAISLLSVALQQCIKATSPTATVLLESILERKWQHPAIYAIVCLMVVGPVLAQFGSTFGDADPVGIVMMVLAVISGAFKYVLAHKVIKEYRHSMGTLAFTFWVEVIVGVVLLPWALLNGELYKLATGEEASTVGEWVLLLLTAAYGGVRIFSQFYLLQFTSATTLSLSNMAIQAFTIILGILFFGIQAREGDRDGDAGEEERLPTPLNMAIQAFTISSLAGRRRRDRPLVPVYVPQGVEDPRARQRVVGGLTPRQGRRRARGDGCPRAGARLVGRRGRDVRRHTDQGLIAQHFPGPRARRTTPRVLTSYVTR